MITPVGSARRHYTLARFRAQWNGACASDFGTTEDGGERSRDYAGFLTPWPVATGGVYFQTDLLRIVCRLIEFLRCALVVCRKRGHPIFSCCASTAVGSARPGKTEPQEQQQLGAAVHPVFAAVEVP